MSQRRWHCWAILAACVLLAIGGCAPARRPACVIFISIDTCRADHLSCYGFRRPTTPNMDGFAREAILFTRAFSPVPMTFPAHCTILTGVSPLVHGVHDNLGFRLDDGQATLAESLHEAGFATGAIVSATVLDSRFGLDQGFDSWNDVVSDGSDPDGEYGMERRADEVTRLGIEWLDRNQQGKRFLLLHYFDPHAPYDPPEPFASAFRDDLYAGEVAFTDQEIGRFFDHLRRIGLYESSLIVIVGDHGESLGEHGEATHDYFIYESTMHVPLLVKPPFRREGLRRDELVGLADLAPTILRAVGVAAPEPMRGLDLLAEPRPDDPRVQRENGLYMESLTPTRYGCNALFGLRTEDWKYIQSTRPELYNLATDPRELTNLIGLEPQRGAQLRQTLERLIASERVGTTPSGRSVPDQETLERIRSLGYVGSGPVTGAFDFEATRPDAKDRLELHTAFGAAIRLVARSDWDRARTACEEILRAHPEMSEVHVLLGQIAAAQRSFPEAIRQYELALQTDDAGGESGGLRLTPDRPRIHLSLGNALAEVGRKDEAIAHYRAALKLQSDFAEAHLNLGITLGERGRIAEAEQEFHALLAQVPEHAEAHYNLGLALLQQQRTDAAVHEFSEALRIRPGFAPARVKLGDVELALGRPDAAARNYAEALRHPPVPAEAWYKLPRALVAAGRLAEGVDAYRKAVIALPDEPVVAAELAWVLATSHDDRLRNGSEAVRLAEEACRRTAYREADLLATLAAAYAEAGRFEEAVQTEERVLELVRLKGQPSSIVAIQERIARYRSRQATRSRF